MTRRIVFAMVIGLLLCAGTVGAQKKTEITVGYAVSQTGRFSTEAVDVQSSYQLWADEVNRKGGIQVRDQGGRLKVKLLAYDDQSDASGSAKLYERLMLQDKVDLLLSPWGSGINFAVTAITEKQGYPLVLTSAASDTIYQRSFRHVFATDAMASVHGEALLGAIEDLKGQVKTVAVLYENFLFTETVAKGFKERAEKAGLNLVMYERYPIAAREYTSLLLRVKSLNPDAVVVLNIMPAGLYLTRQLREMNLTPKIYFTLIGPAYEKEFRSPLGPLAEGILENGDWHPDVPFPGAKEFNAAFRARYNKPVSPDAAFAYIGAQILEQAVEKAGTLDRAKITEALHTQEFSTVGGPYRYDQNGVNTLQDRQNFLVQVQGGERVIVWPAKYAKGKLRFPVFQP